jgi:DNA polymerase-3 subunit delta'
MIRAGTHPDLHVVTKELAAISREAEVRGRKQMTIPKGVIDEFLVEPASRTRSMGGDCLAGKVFIVDEAELLDPRTQNSLLKVMEEPAPGSVIILVTSQEERLLPTIRSRCQRVAFGPLDDAAMRAWLDSKGLGEGERARAWLLQTSNGSPGAALAAVENGLYEWHETLAPMLRDLDTARFPADLGAALVRFVDERAADWVKRNRDASKDAANKAWAARVLAFLAEHERRTLRDGVAGGAEERRVRRHLAAIELIAQAESQIHANVNLGLAMENLVAQMAREAV